MKKAVIPVLAAALVATLAAVPGRADANMIALRQRYFGAENVDPSNGAVRADRVILSWVGVTNFAAAIGGHVVMLDAWVPRGEYSGYVPSSPGELAALDPEFVFVGHSHFDHAADAAPIAAASGATVVGTPEHCAQIRSQAAPTAITCVDAVAAGTQPGAEGTLDGVLSGVGIRTLKHIHSAAEPPDPNEPHGPAAPRPDANAVAFHLPAPQDTQHLASHLGDSENGTIMYRFDVGDFSLVWHDSSGPLAQLQPSLLEQMKSFGPADVELGAIMGFNQITNGLRDPRTYTESIAPKIFVPAHHDNWAPGLSTRGENYEQLVRDEYARIPADRRPTIRFISDPQDYVRPEVLTFDVTAPYWR